VAWRERPEAPVLGDSRRRRVCWYSTVGGGSAGSIVGLEQRHRRWPRSARWPGEGPSLEAAHSSTVAGRKNLYRAVAWLPGGTDVEIITWLDDHSRYALSVTAHRRITAAIVAATFGDAAAQHGFPASTLTDNGMVYTVRLASRPGGRTALEHELRRRGIDQKNSRPNHPTTCGKVERFQQTLKNWLRAQPRRPATIAGLQALLEEFVEIYNQQRPHRSLPHRATPATAYTTRPKAAPGVDRATDTHDRVRTDKIDKIDKSGTVTLRVAGRLRHIGIGRTHSGPTSCCSPTTTTYASSTPPPANSCANWRSTPPATTSPDTHRPRNDKTPAPTQRGSGRPGCPETSHRRPRQDSNLRHPL
jgi:hypothetical protein